MEKDFILRKVITITFVGFFAGKTSFLKRYLLDKFDENLIMTIGIEKIDKIYQLSNGKEIKLILQDISGNERYKPITSKYVVHSDGVIIMYDVTNRRSFEEALYWINEIRNYKDDIPVIIIGNRIDIENRRVILKNEGEELAQQYNYHFYESSCKLKINIKEPIDDLVEIIYQKNKDSFQEIKLNKNKKNKNEVIKKEAKKEKKEKIEAKNKSISNQNLNKKSFFSKIYSNYLNY